MKVFLLTFFTSVVWVSFLPDGMVAIAQSLEELEALQKCGDNNDDTSEARFVCVPYHKCDADTNTVIARAAFESIRVNIRLGIEDRPKCGHYMQVCCKQGDITPEPTTSSPVPPISNGTKKLEFCGTRNKEGLDFNITGNTNEALFGEFPWMVAILRKHVVGNEDQAICGGSLIAPNVVLTGAHRVVDHTIDEIKVRVGEWDTQTTLERIPYQERNVVQKIIHEDFNNGNYHNDLALLILDRKVNKADNVGTICLPRQDQSFNSQECYATGWGKTTFGAQSLYAVILKKIRLPLVQHESCQNALRKTHMGRFFILDESFVCAGGQKNMDTCLGDGGAPLVCPDPSNEDRYVQVGIVSWGIGCGEDQIPAVYVNVAHFRNWVDEKLQALGITTVSYN